MQNIKDILNLNSVNFLDSQDSLFKSAEKISIASLLLIRHLRPFQEDSIEKDFYTASKKILPFLINKEYEKLLSTLMLLIAYTKELVVEEKISLSNAKVFTDAVGEFAKKINYQTKPSISFLLSDQEDEELSYNLEQPSSKPKRLKTKKESKKRREAIIEFLTKKPSANIKEIANAIQGVSAKTIQRELQAMINDGIVKKTGSKRWTTYSLQ